MNLSELLNIKYPVIQGGMARIARGKLAAAVSNAGGLGLVGTGGFTVDEFKKELAIAKENIEEGKIFGVNLVLIEKDIEEKIAITIEEKVPVVTMGAGNPAPYMPHLLEAGLVVIPVVGNTKMAKKVETLGAQACIIEGMEAGGHLGKMGSMASILQVSQAVSIPVIAAGGIGHGAQVLAAQAMGAGGVQMGTRFLVAEETEIHENFKQALIDAKDYETDITGVTKNEPVRQLSNDMTKAYIKKEFEGADPKELTDLVKGSLARAIFDGDIKTGSMMAGQIVGILDEVQTVDEIFEQMVREYKEAKESLANSKDFLF